MIRASESPYAAWRAVPTWIGPVGLADTNSTSVLSRVCAEPPPYASPAFSAPVSASRHQASDMYRLRKPGPATSTRSTSPASLCSTRPPRRSATSRGGLPSEGASSIAALVE